MTRRRERSAQGLVSATSSGYSRPKLGLLQCFLLVAPSAARRWTDIVLPQDLKIRDVRLGFELYEEDPFLAMETATKAPVPTDSVPTSNSQPSVLSFSPPPTMSIPADPNTPEPTPPPTNSPTIFKTPSPTNDPYPENPVPSNPDTAYFNYDPDMNNPYGPGYPKLQRYNSTTLAVGYENNGWESAGVGDNFYWDEFDDDRGFGPWQGVLGPRQPERNLCGRIGEQSPIDVRSSGAECVEHHQIRALPGDFKVSGQEVDKQIHHNKLRLEYQRRPCADLEDPVCAEPDPPHADFPNNWGGFADLMHIDFKVPSEHMIEGQRYDAEMQIFHLHPSRRRTPTVSVVIQATPNGHNYYLQPALDAFEYTYNVHRAQCAAKQRRERQLISDFHEVLGDSKTHSNGHSTDFSSWAEFSTDLDDPDFEEKRELHQRLLQYGVWDPHHVMLVPSIHFYGYEGSLTEPPCGEWVTWYVCDIPMIVSHAQLERMKKLIFTHVDGDCNPTSSHHRQSVARPIQDTGGRPVWHCTPDDYGPDP